MLPDQRIKLELIFFSLDIKHISVQTLHDYLFEKKNSQIQRRDTSSQTQKEVPKKGNKQFDYIRYFFALNMRLTNIQ